MARKSRRIYDNDGTVIEAVETPSVNEAAPMSDTMSVFKSQRSGNTSIPLVDVLENFAAYMLPNFRFLSSTEKGTCLICGKETSMFSRKLCGDCMKENGERLYNLARQAIENGEKEVTV